MRGVLVALVCPLDSYQRLSEQSNRLHEVSAGYELTYGVRSSGATKTQYAFCRRFIRTPRRTGAHPAAPGSSERGDFVFRTAGERRPEAKRAATGIDAEVEREPLPASAADIVRGYCPRIRAFVVDTGPALADRLPCLALLDEAEGFNCSGKLHPTHCMNL